MKGRYSRKEFFRIGFAEAFRLFDEVVQGVRAPLREVERALRESASAPEKPIFVRPPGALPEEAFRAACTRCDECVKACPHWAIRKAGPELGAALAGSPIMIPHESPCLLCTDWPCIAACEAGALSFPAPGTRVTVGRAVVEEAHCYMAQGQPCDYCVKHCPEKPKAIALGAPGEKPAVSDDRCTGCGICAQICPASAIRIVPERSPREDENGRSGPIS
ncbi:MAG: 4Fe-4S dicluster domain-containing protein [Deltaproteobacteria bacterium]|nr:MAG: 4Fe-4S dicluster domain-containing protein [Deltaproteobacteria bacterium]